MVSVPDVVDLKGVVAGGERVNGEGGAALGIERGTGKRMIAVGDVGERDRAGDGLSRLIEDGDGNGCVPLSVLSRNGESGIGSRLSGSQKRTGQGNGQG